jgi:hypothetical protein
MNKKEEEQEEHKKKKNKKNTRKKMKKEGSCYMYSVSLDKERKLKCCLFFS